MGIQLDWEVEAEGGWEEVGEDEQAVLARKRRNRRLRNWLIAIVALCGLAAAGIAVRLRQVNEQARALLEATIAAETLALRIGDREGFLALQSGAVEWRRIQSDTFDVYQALGPRVAPDGEIVALEMDGRRAHAVLREQLDGQPYLITWFYEEGEQGWQHVPPPPEAWGEPVESASAAFDYSFNAADQPLIDALMPALDGWWEEACRLTGCTGDEAPRPRVQIAHDPLATLGWAEDDPWTLTIPAPSLGRVPEEDGPLNAQLAADLSGLVTARWAEVMVRGIAPEPSSDLVWVERELAGWLHHRMSDTAPPSGFIEPLAESYGPGVVPDLLSALRDDDRLVPALEAATGIPAADLPVDWRSYLAYRLQWETRLIAKGHTTEAELLFRDLDAALDTRSALDYATELHADPDSISIVSITPINNAVLAEVHFAPANSRSSSAAEMVAFERFRLTDEGWVHTQMTPEHWGEERTEQSEHFTLIYHELDAEAVEGALVFLEAAYADLAAALSVPAEPAPSFLVSVTPYTPEVFSAKHPPGSRRGYTTVLSISSPHGIARPTDTAAQAYVQAGLAWELAWSLAASQAAPIPAGNPVVIALAGWALGQAGVGGDALIGTAREVYASSQTIQVLVELLVSTYGQEIIPTLIYHLSRSGSTDAWLTLSLGLDDSITIRSQWRACLAGRAYCPLGE